MLVNKLGYLFKIFSIFGYYKNKLRIKLKNETFVETVFIFTIYFYNNTIRLKFVFVFSIK